MSKKLERKIKETLERLPSNRITAIKKIIDAIDIAYQVLDAFMLVILLVVGVFFTVAMVAIGFISVVVACVPIILLMIIWLINLCAKKLKKICNETILERGTNPEINRIEYTQVICIDEKWDDYIHSLKDLVEVLETQEISHNAKLKGDDTIEIILKNKEGERIGRLSVDYDTFLDLYKNPGIEC